MINKTQKASIDKCEIIQLGRIGENLFRTVEIDVSSWELANATYSLVFVRPDQVAYAVPVTYRDNNIVWTPSSYDTAVAGDGYCEIRAIIGEAVGKSAIFKVRIDKSINVVPGEPGVVVPDWLDQIFRSVSIVNIEQTEASDVDGGTNVFTATLTNGETAEFEVKNGNRGAKGDTGPKGDKGDPGPQGITGASGTGVVDITYKETDENGNNVYMLRLSDGQAYEVVAPIGEKGDIGDHGPQGERGEQGPRGEKGDKGDTGAKGDKGDKGDIGPQGPKGDKGDRGDTGPRGEQGIQGIQGERGYSGLVTKQSIPYASSITVPANTMTEIATLAGNITISLGAEVAGYDNEWDFVIEQGSTAYTVTLPQVEWTLGIAPTFFANSLTRIALYKVKGNLFGAWN